MRPRDSVSTVDNSLIADLTCNLTTPSLMLVGKNFVIGISLGLSEGKSTKPKQSGESKIEKRNARDTREIKQQGVRYAFGP